MTSSPWLRAIPLVAVLLLVLDAIWLVAVASPLYDAELGERMAASPDLVAGGLFYVLYVVALAHFAVVPGLRADRAVREVARDGGLLGLTAYGTWALTNKAVLADWPAALVPVDIVWGAVLSATVSVVAVVAGRAWGRAAGRAADVPAGRG